MWMCGMTYDAACSILNAPVLSSAPHVHLLKELADAWVRLDLAAKNAADV